ncbi:uncharacterized protein LOC134272331 isoform X1 [Saccostrea cucullata]|uniref:uncharacterized protein LOC134272331 isoform X1 n=1 Tax=Saccostrea cuccullata TaxID=36930 RepID=UPI002ED1E981
MSKKKKPKFILDMSERNIGMIIFKQCITGVIVAFIFGSIFIFDATLRDFLREARIRDEQLAFLKQKVNKYDEEVSLLKGKNKEFQQLLTHLNKELLLIQQNNTDLKGEARIRDEQLAILKQKMNKHDEKFPLLQEKNNELHLFLTQLKDESSLIKKTEHYFGECLWSDYVNNFDQEFTYAPESYVISGVSSYHQNAQEDRRFKFKVCKLLRR